MSFKNWPVWILVLWTVGVILASFVDFNTNQIHLDLILAKPCFQYILVLDDLGRDILPRLISGAKVSFLVIF